MTRPKVPRTAAPDALRDAFGRLGTGVAVVTTFDEHRAAYGATVTAFAAVSVDPPLIQATLRRTSKATRVLQASPFAVNVLAAGQGDAARHFAGQQAQSAPAWKLHGDVPVLIGNATTFECRAWNVYDGGDHVIVVGEIVALDVGDAEPLLRRGQEAQDGGDWFSGVGSFTPF